jgi:hypothetical protein
MYATSNAKTSQAYAIRTRLGFQILLLMVEKGYGPESLPPQALTMIQTWVQMKAGRPRIADGERTTETLPVAAMQLLRRLPPPNSQEPCSSADIALMAEIGDSLIANGHVEIFPLGLTGEWSYRQSISGEAIVEMVDRER